MMNANEKVLKILSTVTDQIVPQVDDWVDRAGEIWDEVMDEYKARLVSIHEEIQETVGRDHLVVFGAIIAASQPNSKITELLLEYETAGMKLIAKMNDFLGDKEEHDKRRVRTVDNIIHPSKPQAD
jgi:hypothetical protein